MSEPLLWITEFLAEPTLEQTIDRVRAKFIQRVWQEFDRLSAAFCRHLAHADQAGDQGLIHAIAHQIREMHDLANAKTQWVVSDEATDALTQYWYELPGQPLTQSSLGENAKVVFHSDLHQSVSAFVESHLKTVLSDGPKVPLLFAYQGTIYEGLTDKPWRLLNHLWSQRSHTNKDSHSVRSASFLDLSEPVLGDHAEEYTASVFDGHRKACNRFFERHGLPYRISSTGRSKDSLDRTAMLTDKSSSDNP